MHKVQYTLKPGRIEENERLVRSVFEELRRLKPSGLRYACLREKDRATFVHLVVSEPDGGVRMTDFPAFRAFAASIGERCDIPPERTELQLIDAYALFDA
jgi:hypothetical protein